MQRQAQQVVDLVWSAWRSNLVRACLKRSRSGCQTPHHQLNHGNPHPCLGGLGQRLEVFTQPARAIQPAKRALDDPAPLHHPKALRVPGAFHDREGPLHHRRDPCDEFPSVPTISPDQPQSREASDQRRQDLFGSITVLDPRSMPHHDQQETEDIDHDVALAAADALAPIITPDPPFSVVFTL